MPRGKKAGVRCVNLSENNICMIHNTAEYPEVCRNLRADKEMCGHGFKEAAAYLGNLEKLTSP